jgi:hypothetical protein
VQDSRMASESRKAGNEMKRAMKISIGIAGASILTSLVLSQLMCQTAPQPPAPSPSGDALTPDEVATMTAAATLPAGPTSIRVCIVMVVHKQYGLMAHLAGNKDITKTDKPYDAGKSWWDNPMVMYEDLRFPGAGATVGADAASIAGKGQSSNVSVEMILVPHADVTLTTLVKSDCIKGTLKATITTLSEYYDGDWTDAADAKDREIVFELDSSDKSKQMTPTGFETRTLPPFTFGRYVRDHEKWDARNAWPAKAKNGDWRCTINVKDATLAITGYQYLTGETGTRPSTGE